MFSRADDLAALPISDSVVPARHFPSHTMAKAGVVLEVEGASVPVVGFACSTDAQRARRHAHYECFERLLTRPELLGDPGAVVRGATWEATPRARPLSEICPHRGPNRPSVDATGFAFGWTHAHAVQAATLELIERLLVGEVWYGDRRLLEVALDAPAVPAFEVPAPDLRVYVDGSSASLPLAIVAIHDAAAGIMVAGSDVKLSAPAAIEHALEEAVMLFESVHAGHAPSYESANARARYAMLEGRLTHKRAAFLRAKSTPGDVSGRVWPLDAIVDAVHGRDIEIYSLAEGTDFEVVRAIAPQWRLLIDRRADDDRHLLDPFC